MGFYQKLSICFSISLASCALDAGGGADAASEPVGESQSALCSKNALTKSQEKTVLKLVDDICGDTWCEGDNDFSFEQLNCRNGTPRTQNRGTCTLTLQIIPRVADPPVYVRRCTTPGFHGLSSLVDTTANGFQSLNWDYYLALTDCINQHEAALPR